MPWPRALPTTLTRCVLLALLLHLWAVLMLGTAPGGTAVPGQGVGGAINITLRGLATEGLVTPSPQSSPQPANPVQGSGSVPRWGGMVREQAPAVASEPGAARLGQAVPERVAAPAPDPAPTPVLTPGPAAAPQPAPPLQALEPLPIPAPLQALETLPIPAPLPAPAALPLPAPAAERSLDAPLRALPALVPPMATLPPAPVLPAAPSSLPPLPSLPLPSAVIAAPPLERPLDSPLMQALPTPAPSSGLPRAAAMATPPELAAPPVLPDAPPALRSLQAQPSPVPARTPEPALARTPEALAEALATTQPIPGASLPTAQAGAPDAGSQIGRDVATPPAAAASAVPRLNLQLARPRGGELSRYSTTGALPVLPRPPERDDKLAREIEKAGKADCVKAYAGAGLLAVIPLAADALRKDGGCKW